MSLYVIALKVFAYDGVVWGGSRRRFISKYELMIDGDQGDEEGTWRITDAAYYGQRSGPWYNVNLDGDRSIWCVKYERPGMLGVLFWDAPQPGIIVSIDDILHFPLFVGETGYGHLNHGEIAWQVKSRSF